MDQLVPTGATLLVIPHVLMEHWEVCRQDPANLFLCCFFLAAIYGTLTIER